MTDRLTEAANETRAVVASLGRASTPPVPARAVPLFTHPLPSVGANRWPTLVAGDATPLISRRVDCVIAHPNTMSRLLEHPQAFQAFVVNASSLHGVWTGALSGSSRWKTDMIYDALVGFRTAGLPSYLMLPSSETVASYRWASVSSALFPWQGDDAEETGNSRSALWEALMEWGAMS